MYIYAEASHLSVRFSQEHVLYGCIRIMYVAHGVSRDSESREWYGLVYGSPIGSYVTSKAGAKVPRLALQRSYFK